MLLRRQWFQQYRMRRNDKRNRQSLGQVENVAATFAAKNSVFMLDDQQIDMGIGPLRRFEVTAAIMLAKGACDSRVRIDFKASANRNDMRVYSFNLAYFVHQILGKRCQSTFAGRIGAQKSNILYFMAFIHDDRLFLAIAFRSYCQVFFVQFFILVQNIAHLPASTQNADKTIPNLSTAYANFRKNSLA